LPSGDADVIALLCNEGAYQRRRVHVRALFTRDEARFIIRDEGHGFNTQEMIAMDGDPSWLSSAGGHGLVLIRTFVDEVQFNPLGNEITLVKRRAQTPLTAEPTAGCAKPATAAAVTAGESQTEA
jgi:anti-sigma regulatory factor (Ser/Thr protein kinase)